MGMGGDGRGRPAVGEWQKQRELTAAVAPPAEHVRGFVSGFPGWDARLASNPDTYDAQPSNPETPEHG